MSIRAYILVEVYLSKVELVKQSCSEALLSENKLMSFNEYLFCGMPPGLQINEGVPPTKRREI